MGKKTLNDMYEEHRPRTCQFIVSRQIYTVKDVRLQLERLTIDDVLWNPYTEHKAYCPFMSIALFCGYLLLVCISYTYHSVHNLTKQMFFFQVVCLLCLI